MTVENILQNIRENIDAVVNQDTPLGRSLWESFLTVHHVDIAHFLSNISREDAQRIFLLLPRQLREQVFQDCSEQMQIFCLSFLDDQARIEVMHALNADELTNLFDYLSDEELKKYLNLLHKSVRQKVLSLLQFDPKSVGKIMDIDVLTLIDDFTVEKSVKLLQRLRPSRDIHQQIYVTNQAHRLEGHINLEDLVLHKPDERIVSFMRVNELVANAHDDREAVAKKMVHYGLMSVPVVDDNNHFLGVIPSDTLVDVIVQEATEDVQKMAALAPMRDSYLEIPIFRVFYQRGYIFVVLLLAESVSSHILSVHEVALAGLLASFIPMLISTGGNMSNQTSAVVIQEMASGTIGPSDAWRLLRRELLVASCLAVLLSACSFLRVYLSSGAVRESFIVSGTILLIVLLSATLGSGVPLLLRRFNIDPAFSAGPFLATIMDILGVLIFCYVAKLLLF